MRLFIAIRLSDDMRRALLAAQDALRKRGVRGNYTKPENLHLTLAFIGEYPDADGVTRMDGHVELRLCATDEEIAAANLESGIY